ncbi:FkbM family methyltransferase [Aerosakkonemataceae cyanobacterium BLCC-F154]|uniref:FkbM family methyltransferase n=1 Tax=Floridaenema fluviatile BLCC-F154 TaxID=3153640 RepID=A0ABV4YB21_9CYAN
MQILFKLLFRWSRFWLNYGNPLSILWQRLVVKKGKMIVVDRQTGIRCKCNIPSYQMFGETWYNKDYNIPHFSINPGDVVIDIGANQGFFTCYLAYQGAKVFAFEPFTESFQTMLENLELNKLSDRVVAKPWAISGYNGFAELVSTDWLGGGMNTIQSDFIKNTSINTLAKSQVQCFTLNHIIEEFQLTKIRLCKLDCEGAELEILKELDRKHLSKIDAFVLEYHPAYPLEKLLELLMSWGTHQISFAEDNEHCSRSILRLVANRELINTSS